MHRPQDLSIAHDFLVQDAQENHAHRKKYVIKIVIKGSRYFLTCFQEKDVRFGE
jgi:fructose-specific phosphotransferase system component IIB